VNANTRIADAFSRTTQASNQSGTELVIACHGYMTHSYDNMSNVELRGGQGLQLCKESLLVSNVQLASALNGYFSRIWLMACGPAGTLVHASRPFCRELAHYADAPVIASDTAQLYYPGTHDAAARISRQVLRFGTWEGNVYQFSTDGTVAAFTSGETPLP
jgi:hypothetical protein